MFIDKRFNFVQTLPSGSARANLIVLDPPYLQTMSSSSVTDQEVNTLAQVNLGLRSDQVTPESFTGRILESCLEASEPNAIFLIWCSLEQGMEYMKLHKGKELFDQGLKALSLCSINGKRRAVQANQQIPSTTGEYFIVVKKGDPDQATFEKWGEVYDDANKAPRDLGNVFNVPQSWWDSQSNRYPYMKPRRLMRMLVNYFARPGQLVFEGFAGTISCGLAALTCGVNLVAVDNNADTKRFLRDLYQELRTGVTALEELDDSRSNLEPHASMFMTNGMVDPPHYELFAPVEWHDSIPVVNTEESPFTEQPRLPIIRIRSANLRLGQAAGQEEVIPQASATLVYPAAAENAEEEQSEEEVYTPITPQKRTRESDSDDNGSTNSFEDASPAY